MTNSADPTQVKEARRKATERADQELADLRELLKLPEGRRFIWRIIKTWDPMESAFNPNGSIQSVNLGRGDVTRQIVKWLEQADPKVYAMMMLESVEASQAI